MKHTSLILIMALAVSIIGCQNKTENKQKHSDYKNKTRVKTELVKTSESMEAFNYSGTIEPSLSTQLSFLIPGQISKIHVEEGDMVRQGQVLMELDKTSLSSAHKAALAMKIQAEDAYNRLKSVYEKGSLPDIQWEELKAKLEQAKSAETIARENLKNGNITAPNSGVIGKITTEIGSNVITGIPTIELIEIKDVFVKIAVPENEINKIKKEQAALIQIPAIGISRMQGKVEKIGVIANRISKTYEVKLRVENSEQKIKPGMVCDVNMNIPIAHSSVLIPIQSILKDTEGKNYVYVVDKKKNIAQKRSIELGEIWQNQIQVKTGLIPGELIVVNGQHKLDHNAAITY